MVDMVCTSERFAEQRLRAGFGVLANECEFIIGGRGRDEEKWRKKEIPKAR